LPPPHERELRALVGLGEWIASLNQVRDRRHAVFWREAIDPARASSFKFSSGASIAFEMVGVSFGLTLNDMILGR